MVSRVEAKKKKMEHQTLREGGIHHTLNEEDILRKYYYNGLTPAPRETPLSSGGVRLAPLAEFDKDFDIPHQASRHKVKLFKALYIFFSGVLLLIGLASASLGVYWILDEERVQMHQIILVNLGDIPDISKSQAQPVLYYLSLAIVGSGIVVALWSLFNFLPTSKEQVFLIVLGILLLTIIFAAQVTLAFFAVSFHLRAHEDLREELLTRLQNQYNEIGGEFFSPALDFVQTKFQCCGIIDEGDYAKSLWRSQALGGEDLVYPLSCCKLSNANDLSSYLNPMAVNLEKCMSSDIRLNGVDRHHQGCLQDILEWSTLEFVIIIAISCGCALVELMSICIGIYVLKHLRRRSIQK